ncbi:12337_t:CDS:2, partial [Acaulospora colombiana]
KLERPMRTYQPNSMIDPRTNSMVQLFYSIYTAMRLTCAPIPDLQEDVKRTGPNRSHIIMYVEELSLLRIRSEIGTGVKVMIKDNINETPNNKKGAVEVEEEIAIANVTVDQKWHYLLIGDALYEMARLWNELSLLSRYSYSSKTPIKNW